MCNFAKHCYNYEKRTLISRSEEDIDRDVRILMGKMVDEYGSDTRVKGWCLSKSQTCDLLGISLYHMSIKMKDGTSPMYRRSTGTKRGRLYFDFVAVARWIVENQIEGVEFR